MPSPTERLQQLLTDGITKPDFKALAMSFVSQGADSTVSARSGSRDTLLHILVRTNKKGINNSEIALLAPFHDAAKNQYGKTALEALAAALPIHKEAGAADAFKQSSMLLIPTGIDVPVTLQESLDVVFPNFYCSYPVANLYKKIQTMRDYGILLKNEGVLKGQLAIDIARTLRVMLQEFLGKKNEERDYFEFESQFSTVLHSKDKEMSACRISWQTLLANIAIALTGIGLLFIAGKIIHSNVTENRTLFFFQKSKTTSEENIADIDQATRFIYVS